MRSAFVTFVAVLAVQLASAGTYTWTGSWTGPGAVPTSVPAAPAAATCPADLNALAGQKGPHPRSEDSFHFVVISDNTGGADPGKWEQAIREINLLRPDFVISVGDVIEGYSKDSQQIQKMWDHFDEINSKLDAPYFFCPGNHDVTNDVERPLYDKRHGVNGKSYYSFDYKGCHFVVMNTHQANDEPAFAAEQKAWFEKDLAAAKDARHTFIFMHFPAWLPESLGWVTKLVDPAKTTIFSGHTHVWSYSKVNGVPNYVIACTGTVARSDSDLTGCRMFAQVWVEKGESTVAVIPVGSVKSAEYAEKETMDALAEPRGLTASRQGGEMKVTFPNALSRPMKVHVAFSGQGWDVAPGEADVTIDPKSEKTLSVNVKPVAESPAKLTAIVDLETTNSDGQVVKARQEAPVMIFRAVDIPTVSGITVDGSSEEWKTAPVAIKGKGFLFYGGHPGLAEPKASAQWWIGHDAEKIYGCVKVVGDPTVERGVDLCKFFWDARPAGKRNDRHGPGTGSIIIFTPAEGKPAEAKWMLEDAPAPKGMEAAWKQVADGYVYEWSVPLREMGLAEGAKSLNVEVQFDAAFGSADGSVTEYFSSSGYGKGGQQTGHYCQGTLK